ncbi:hypothetical protein PGIGA_G00247040 [Pangasianodon gigas]|uniref:Uncharacterized protein n=1 Tax=Pangasianodon gigas TaxID=30993 RepID=A0ACC5WPT3_PANGG|nr:hypothetical protein [Pangasianodon gigas]
MKMVTFIPIILIIHTTVTPDTLTIVDRQEDCPLTAILSLSNLSNLSRMMKRASGHDFQSGLACCSCSVQKGLGTRDCVVIFFSACLGMPGECLPGLYLSLHCLILISVRRVSSLTRAEGEGTGRKKIKRRGVKDQISSSLFRRKWAEN